eukprot:6186411-Pleurochrysis_carterae.AAC.5
MGYPLHGQSHNVLDQCPPLILAATAVSSSVIECRPCRCSRLCDLKLRLAFSSRPVPWTSARAAPERTS